MASEHAEETPDEFTPAERLRALELSGDPDAREIARGYKSTPLDSVGPGLRQVRRASRPAFAAFRPTYAQATEEDADEAEELVAQRRAARESDRRAREGDLHRFATAADRRERTMLRLTWVIAVLALASLAASATAVVIALSS